jgi:hypothetical protein
MVSSTPFPMAQTNLMRPKNALKHDWQEQAGPSFAIGLYDLTFEVEDWKKRRVEPGSTLDQDFSPGMICSQGERGVSSTSEPR